jgi:hypothetical protein
MSRLIYYCTLCVDDGGNLEQYDVSCLLADGLAQISKRSLAIKTQNYKHSYMNFSNVFINCCKPEKQNKL